jgi:hypothetical protein
MDKTRIVTVTLAERAARRHLDRAQDHLRRAGAAAIAGEENARDGHLLHASRAAEDAARVLRGEVLPSDGLAELVDLARERNRLMRKRWNMIAIEGGRR